MAGDRLAGKVAIVTGAARGMGEAEARLFAAEGAKVVIADVLDDVGKAVADDIGTGAVYVHLDVGDEDDWRRAIEAAGDFGGLDVLVNNAAIYRPAAIVDTTLDEYMAVVRVNQVGTFLGIRSAIEPMKARGGGSIVNVSSIDGLGSKNGLMAYSASKFAVRGMTKTAAIELGYYGIRVNSVHPGGVNTAMMNPDGYEVDLINRGFRKLPLRRVGEPSEVAHMALFLASDESSYCTGAEFVVDGGWTCGDLEPFLPGAPPKEG